MEVPEIQTDVGFINRNLLMLLQKPIFSDQDLNLKND